MWNEEGKHSVERRSKDSYASMMLIANQHQKRLIQVALDELWGIRSESSSSTSNDSDRDEIKCSLDANVKKIPQPTCTEKSASHADLLPSKTPAPLSHDISFLKEYEHLFTPGCMVCQIQFKHLYRDYVLSAEFLAANTLSMGEFLIVESGCDPTQHDLGILTKVYTLEAFYAWKRLRGRSQDQEENSVGRVLRVATLQERQLLPIKNLREKPILDMCHQLTLVHRINMRVYGVEYQFDGQIVFVYYTADSRVDYRTFVYDLVKQCNRTRVKMKKTNQCRKFVPKEWAAQALITGHTAKV